MTNVARFVVLAVAACAALLVSACQTPAHETSPPTLAALQGDYFRLDSTVLGRPLHIHVNLPENYAANAASYPTVYLTDGDSLFPLLAPTQLFLTYDEPVPPAILVGIAYGTFDPEAGNLRHVDFTWPHATAADKGAAAFQSFLAEELIPEIERRYRSDPQRRILVGQSRGGGFVLYSALTAPDMFWGRIASNPALRGNRDAFFAPAAPATREGLALFVASGERDRADIRAETLQWAAHWQSQGDLPWTLELEMIENGTHAATIGEVYRRGMISRFAGAQQNAD